MPPRLSRAIDYVVLGIAGVFAMLFLPLLGIAALGIFDAAPSSADASAGGTIQPPFPSSITAPALVVVSTGTP